MRPIMLTPLLLLVTFVATAHAAEPVAATANPPAEMRDDPRCGMMLLLLNAPVPTSQEVGIPAFPGAIFSGATGAGTGELNNVSYDVLASVFLLTTADPDEVAAFYWDALDDSWQHGTAFGSHVFYQHEPVDAVVELLLERPGALPVVEIVEVWSDCDRLLVPGARSAIRLYYPPRSGD